MTNKVLHTILKIVEFLIVILIALTVLEFLGSLDQLFKINLPSSLRILILWGFVSRLAFLIFYFMLITKEKPGGLIQKLYLLSGGMIGLQILADLYYNASGYTPDGSGWSFHFPFLAALVLSLVSMQINFSNDSKRNLNFKWTITIVVNIIVLIFWEWVKFGI